MLKHNSKKNIDLKKTFNLEPKKSIKLEVPFDLIAFEHSIRIYINKPQVVNKWVAGSIICNVDKIKNYDLFQDYDTECREFISKSNKIFTNLKYFIIFGNQEVLFKPITKPNDTTKYASVNLCHLFEFNNNSLDLYTELVAETDDKINLQIKWLEDNLMPKLVSWLNVKTDEFFTSSKLNTLTLYDNMVNDYVLLYQEMKEIYFKLFESNWFETTNTNPEKYIHEDIAIACYLILAWKYLNIEVKKFIDIGCGNGLLVYILNDQGFNGYGVDMRRRKIWENENYKNKKINLVEATINPQNDLFEDCDWLIGNHSDELSPWLPVIASKTAIKTGLKCNFILIPCCFFDFFNKYDVKRNNESRYDTYLNYLENIFNICNFKVIKDKLRIPSTRNICFISQMNDVKDLDNEKLNNLVDQSANIFKPRDLELENLKSTRNCTKNVEYELKTHIVKKVMEKLLNESEEYLEKYDGSKWNCGKVVELNEIAKLFDQLTLNKLKQECGGIKTLLKNFHQLFEIINKDKVKIKISKPVNDSANKNLKTKECLFEIYHPNGCLLLNNECSFIHLK